MMGAEDVPERVDRAQVVAWLVDDPGSASSILGSLGAARENARRARETLSTEMWQVLNTTWTTLPRMRRSGVNVHGYLTWVRARSATVAGVTDATMSHDDCWHFVALGRTLERADMTTRLVAMRAIEGGQSWTHLMRSCGAYEAFLRSVFAALTAAETALVALEPTDARPGWRKAPGAGSARCAPGWITAAPPRC